jgi:hypothetical protein
MFRASDRDGSDDGGCDRGGHRPRRHRVPCVPIVGAFFVSRQPHNSIGWVMFSIGVSNGLADALGIYSHYGASTTLRTDDRSGVTAGPAHALALEAPMCPCDRTPGTFFILLFPDGHLPSARWKAWSYFWPAAMIVAYPPLRSCRTPSRTSDTPGSVIHWRSTPWPVGNVLSLVVSIPIAILGCAVALSKTLSSLARRHSHPVALVGRGGTSKSPPGSGLHFLNFTSSSL